MNGHPDDLLQNIIEIIADLKPDAGGNIKLPTERAMAERLGAQRTTIRERLSTLEALGFIERTQGSGTYLSLPRSDFMQMYFKTALKLGYVQIDEMQDAMEMIIREVAAAAAVNATAENIAALEAALETVAASTSLDELTEAQFSFLQVLARATHNPVILLMIDGLSMVLREVLRQRLRLLRMVSGAVNHNLDAHRNVINAVRDREPDIAQSAINDYFWLWKREAAKVSMLYVGFDEES